MVSQIFESENPLADKSLRSLHVSSQVSSIGNNNHSGLHKAYIALGSNLDERQGMIESACLEMDRRNVHVRRTSFLYETKPMYYHDQDPFLNGVCEVSKEGNLFELLHL